MFSFITCETVACWSKKADGVCYDDEQNLTNDDNPLVLLLVLFAHSAPVKQEKSPNLRNTRQYKHSVVYDGIFLNYLINPEKHICNE